MEQVVLQMYTSRRGDISHGCNMTKSQETSGKAYSSFGVKCKDVPLLN